VHWKIELNPKPLEGYSFCKEHLKRFEVKDLNYIRYRKCKDGYVVYGHCVHYSGENKWYLSCCLPGPFPNTIYLEYGGELTLNSLDEGFVFLYGHEIYHYLVQSKQLKQKDSEVNADRYAKKLYDKFVK
jgi:hypothetical protein